MIGFMYIIYFKVHTRHVRNNKGGRYMNSWNKVVLTIIIIGAVNWGLIGFFSFDLVAWIFGGQAALVSRIIYGAVGLAGLYAISFFMMNDNTPHPSH